MRHVVMLLCLLALAACGGSPRPFQHESSKVSSGRQIRDKVEDAYRADTLARALTAQATAAEAAVKAGATLAAQGTVTPIAPLTRDAAPDRVPAHLITTVVTMTPGPVRLGDRPVRGDRRRRRPPAAPR